jgi:sugar phosphate isomerase/epimerase
MAARDDNRRAVDERRPWRPASSWWRAAARFARPGSTPSKDLEMARAMIEDGIAELLTYARTAKLPLAIEPLHPMYAADRAAVNTLAQALDIAERLDSGGRNGALGVAVDVYHTWWDADLYAGIARAGRERRLLAYHVCDWLVPTTDLLNDRGMMGDGVIELRRIRQAVEDAGFTGFSEAEIFSERWWSQPIDTVLGTVPSAIAPSHPLPRSSGSSRRASTGSASGRAGSSAWGRPSSRPWRAGWTSARGWPSPCRSTRW